jgi:predicted SPOUT superfamily RNA methylase MTH1
MEFVRILTCYRARPPHLLKAYDGKDSLKITAKASRLEGQPSKTQNLVQPATREKPEVLDC